MIDLTELLTPNLPLLTLVAFRALGFFCLLPLGSSAGLLALRFVYAVGAALVVVPDWSLAVTATPLNCGAEFLIGFLLALPAQLLLSGASLCGELFDLGRGQSLGAIYDPLSNQSQSLCGFFGRELLWLMVVCGGLAEWILNTLSSSVLSISPGALSTADLVTIAPKLIMEVLLSLNTAFLWALPILTCCLVADLCGAFIGKLVPRISLAPELFQMRSIMGGLILIGFWRFDLFSSVHVYLMNSLPRLGLVAAH